MSATAASRLYPATGVALACAAALALIGVTASAGAGSAALHPDLVTVAFEQEDVVIEREGKRTLLRLSNEIGNIGGGPLEISPSASSQDCDGDGDPDNDRDASQRTYADGNGDGVFDADVDPVDAERVFGCMQYHPAHDHWHVLDFSRYALRSQSARRDRVRSSKIGFCVVDSRRAFPGAGSPAEPGYPVGSPAELEQRGCQAAETQGLSPGWADTYRFNLPGQELDVTKLPAGRYCLSSEADPSKLIEERDEANNATRVKLALWPERLRVRVLDESCRG